MRDYATLRNDVDIVVRLRRCVAGLELPVPIELAREAADEIERLRALLGRIPGQDYVLDA